MMIEGQRARSMAGQERYERGGGGGGEGKRWEIEQKGE